MKKLSGKIINGDEQVPFQGDRILLELGNDRVIVIARSLVHGNDGLNLACGIDRKNVASNGRFVLRTSSFNNIEITVEPAK